MHVTGFVPVQTPPLQESFRVQALPSVHGVPSLASGLEHEPVPGLHVPTPWQASRALQTTGLAPVHAPFWQVSTVVQALPSVHGLLFAFGGLEQLPVPESQTPAVWHWSWAAQTTGLAPVHVPFWQESTVVQALLSLHVVPVARGTAVQAPFAGLQVPMLQTFVSEPQLTAVPDWQVSVARLHVSVPLQALPSSQSWSIVQCMGPPPSGKTPASTSIGTMIISHWPLRQA